MNKKKSRKGYNSYKYSILNQVQKGINTLDLGGIPLSKTQDVILEKIRDNIKSKGFPLRVITHNISDKIIMLNQVVERFKKCKMVILDSTNPFTFTILREG
jgi:hypothetical protein